MKRAPRSLDVDEREPFYWLGVSEREVRALVHGRVPVRVRLGFAVSYRVVHPTRAGQRQRTTVLLGAAR